MNNYLKEFKYLPYQNFDIMHKQQQHRGPGMHFPPPSHIGEFFLIDHKCTFQHN